MLLRSLITDRWSPKRRTVFVLAGCQWPLQPLCKSSSFLTAKRNAPTLLRDRNRTTDIFFFFFFHSSQQTSQRVTKTWRVSVVCTSKKTLNAFLGLIQRSGCHPRPLSSSLSAIFSSIHTQSRTSVNCNPRGTES